MSKPEPIFTCNDCGAGIFEGDYYFIDEIDGLKSCDVCMMNGRKVAKEGDRQ